MDETAPERDDDTVDGRADGRTGGRADGRTGGRADGRTGGRADTADIAEAVTRLEIEAALLALLLEIACALESERVQVAAGGASRLALAA